jgi:transcriptional regulator with XRE-family HTH domain
MAGPRSAPPHDHSHALAQRVRALREDRGWTRERLAKEAGIAVGTLGRLENGGAIQPGFFTVGAVADVLGVALDDLFRTAQVPPVTPGLWSAGYEGRDIDSFVASLLDSRISVVADVRLTPISRKKGFSKTRLGEALAEADIEYVHLRGLGNPKDNRAPFWEGRLAEGRAKFRGVMRSDEARSDLDRLAVHARQSRVAVLCFEKDEERCHRQVVLEAVRKQTSLPVTALA